MTDSMKFGPEWLRNMNSEIPSLAMGSGFGGGNSPSSDTTVANDTAPIIMAQFRYGREEMLLLFNRCNLPPDSLIKMQGLYVDKKQTPINLITLTEEETRMWNRGINSDAALRLAKPGAGPGLNIPGTRGALAGRGGSVDRSRGRARGSYHYSRGLSYEDTENSNGYNSRGMRSYDRSSSQGSWSERNGGDAGDYTATSPRKEFGGRSLSDTNWRRHRSSGGDDDETWRPTRTEKWGRGGGNSWRESDNNWDRSTNHPPSKKPWDNGDHNLPEWAMENPSERGGTFDASGAFHGSSPLSDEDESEGQPKVDKVKKNSSSTSQPRPSSQSKKDPPNISNSNTSNNDSSKRPLKQSQSATNLSPECITTTQSITTSVSFSGQSVIDSHSTQTSKENEPLPQRNELPSKPPVPFSRQSPTTIVTQNPVEAPTPAPPPEPKACEEVDVDQSMSVFVSRLTQEEEEKDPLPPPPEPSNAPSTPQESMWYYQDPHGMVQGPFMSTDMADWYTSGYFKGSLLVRRARDEQYSLLGDLMKLWKVPFMLDYYQLPPIKNSEPVAPVMDEEVMRQIQVQQQQQRILMQRAALVKLTQSEQFNSLPLEQQQMVIHRAQMDLQAGGVLVHHTPPQSHTNANVIAMIQQLAHYQQHPKVRVASQVPVSSPMEALPDPVQHLMQQIGLQTSAPRQAPPPTEPEQRSIDQFMNAFRQRQSNTHPMESVWGGTNVAPNYPGWNSNPSPSLWADQTTKGVKTEQEILEEQLRLEEKKKEEIRKQEEIQRLKEEEERQRRLKEEEELERRRKEEEERERKRALEEEERRKKEAAAAKKAEQDKLRKEEEKKRREEEKRRKDEEKRQEEKKRAEAEKRKQEEERKKKEEIAKRQNEALKRVREQQARAVVKPAPAAPWTTLESAGPSLPDIQKTERKQQQLREQNEMLRVYEERHQKEQQMKNSKPLNMKWADPAGINGQPTRVKSLAEIQAEEQERIAKQIEREKAERMAAAKEVPNPTPGSIWATTPSWNAAWGNATTSAVSSGPRFWDEVNTKAAAKSQQQPPVNKSQAKTKAKKEQATVMKLFEKQLPKTSKSEEFHKWCSKALGTASSGIAMDVTTFVEFLLSIESKKEVKEYIIISLGNTQEVTNFASEFIERRSRLFSTDQPPPPVRQDPTVTPQVNHFQEVKGKNKKKNKMTKVDSRILGFNVTSAPDRINVGDRDYVEGL